MDYKLKPCPFCGHTAHISALKQGVRSRYYVCCGNSLNDCIASNKYVFGMFYANKQDAINAWNRRDGVTDEED